MMQHKGGIRHLSAMAAALAAVPGVALAQSAAPAAAPQYGYLPPKIVKHGTASSMPAGTGTVIVKVFVKKDGTAEVQSIIKSSNHELDAAALEIAKSSTYRAATNNHKPVDAFYDYTLRFAGGSASEQPAVPAGLEGYEHMVLGNPPNYAGAKSGLESYLEAHPGDPTALTYLGLADYFLEDYDAATDSFEKVGDKLESPYKTVAASAYAQTALKQSEAKNYDRSTALAKQAVDLAPSYPNYNTLGLTQLYAGRYPDAISALEKARSLAESAKAPNEKRAAIEVNLVSAYLSAGQTEQAKASAAAATRLNPKASTAVDTAVEKYYDEQAQTNVKLQKYAEAANSYEQGAAAAPSAAGPLYAQAAIMYLKTQPNADYAKAQAAAEKALALDANNELANYAEGLALAGLGKKADALTYLNKAGAAAKAAGDNTVLNAVEAAIKQLNATK
jgi:TonB family protein